MPRRDNDDLTDNDLPTMVPDQDDMASRQRGKSEVEKPVVHDKEKSRNSSGTAWGSIIILLGLAAGLASVASWNYSLQQSLYQQQDALNLSRLRIADLESKLSSTDESMSKSSVVMQVQLKDLLTKTDQLWEQMDKLWASAWRRNQKDLSDQGKQIKEQQGQLDSQKNQLENLKSDLVGAKATLDSHGKRLTGFDDAARKIQAIGTHLDSLQSSVQRSTDIVNQQVNLQKKLEQRVATNEEWIQSINVFRKQVNASLDQLRQSTSATQVPVGKQ